MKFTEGAWHLFCDISVSKASLGWGHEEIVHSSRIRVMLENGGLCFTKLKIGKLRPKMSGKN